jgi:hypothetical protein
MVNTTGHSSSEALYLPEAEYGSECLPEAGALPAFLEQTLGSLEDYARREPWAFAGWVFGVGFILGWKLKPW